VHRAKQFCLDHNGMVSSAWFQVFVAKLSVHDSGVFVLSLSLDSSLSIDSAHPSVYLYFVSDSVFFCALTFLGFRFFHSPTHSLALSLFLFKAAAEVAGMIHSDFGSF